MKLMLAVAFVIAFGTMTASAHPLAASTFATYVADMSGAGPAPGPSVRLIDTAGPEATPDPRIVSMPLAESAVKLTPSDTSVTRDPSPTDVVAVDDPLRAGGEVHDSRNDDRPLIQKAGSPTFPCRRTSEMLTHGLTQGSIPAVRVTVAASLVSWCSQQLDAVLEAGKDVAAVVEPTSLVAEPVDQPTTFEERPKLIPRHVGQCGGESEL